MYKQALEFRTGHYFVAYISSVFAIICGYRHDYHNEIVVTFPLSIEWPQSLLHVVVHWNAPMHCWLKKCKWFLSILFVVCESIIYINY